MFEGPHLRCDTLKVDTFQRAIAVIIVRFTESRLSVKWNCGVKSPSLQAEFITRPSR